MDGLAVLVAAVSLVIAGLSLVRSWNATRVARDSAVAARRSADAAEAMASVDRARHDREERERADAGRARIAVRLDRSGPDPKVIVRNVGGADALDVRCWLECERDDEQPPELDGPPNVYSLPPAGECSWTVYD